MKNYWYIIENVYNRMGFIQDLNYTGCIIKKPGSISNKIRYHTKILSSNLQGQLRQNKEEDAIINKREKIKPKDLKKYSVEIEQYP